MQAEIDQLRAEQRDRITADAADRLGIVTAADALIDFGPPGSSLVVPVSSLA